MPAPGPAPVDTPQAPASPLKVVVVDDNLDSADSLRAVLQLAGHEVRTANDGCAAVALTRDFEPHLVFMDIGMPGMDGLEATRRIRQSPAGERTFVVALTGWGQRQDRERTRAAGVDRHVVKPIGPEELAEVLALVSERLQVPVG